MDLVGLPNKENVSTKDGNVAATAELLKEAIDEAEAYYEKYQQRLADLTECRAARQRLKEENQALCAKIAAAQREKNDLKDDSQKMLQALRIADEEMASTKRAYEKLERAHHSVQTAHEAQLRQEGLTAHALRQCRSDLADVKSRLEAVKSSYRTSCEEVTKLQVLLEKEMDEKAELQLQLGDVQTLLLGASRETPESKDSCNSCTQTVAPSSAWNASTSSSLQPPDTPASKLTIEDVTDEEEVHLQLPGSTTKLSFSRGVERIDTRVEEE